MVLAAGVIIAAAFTGSFRRFERIAITFCAGSLLLIPLVLLTRPDVGQMAHGFAVPGLPGGSGQMATVMLLIIGIVGTTVAPWQLFFQQSYVIDKRITPRFMRYEKADLWIGIVIVVVGAAAVIGATAAAFAGTKGAGNFTDSAGLAHGIAAYAGRAAGVVFAVALLDASIIGAFAVSLSSAYAIGDVLGLRHSLHRGFRQAKGFYAIYAALIAGAATIVLIPGTPLGLLTEGVQALAGVLLPSATIYLLLLCTDRAVLGPVGQRPQDDHVRLGRGRAAGRAVGRADRLGAVHGHHGAADHRDHVRVRGRGGDRGGLGAGAGAPVGGRRAGRPDRAGQLADAAAGHAGQAGHVHGPQGRPDRAALLPGHRDDPGHRQARADGHRALTGPVMGEPNLIKLPSGSTWEPSRIW